MRHRTSSRRSQRPAILLMVAMGLAACNDVGALGTISPDQLFAATNLTATERKDYIQSLNWRLTALAKLAARDKSRTPPPEVIEELCECVVDNLQDRTTRLQFSIAMETIKTGG